MLARVAYQRMLPEAIRALGTLRVAIWMRTAVSDDGSTFRPERAAIVSLNLKMRSMSALWRATASSGESFGPSVLRRSHSVLMVCQDSDTLNLEPTLASLESTAA